MRIPLLRGRWFDDNDRADKHAGCGRQQRAMARQYWSRSGPHRQTLQERARTARGSRLVGVSGNVVHNWFTRQDETVYRPISQDAPNY